MFFILLTFFAALFIEGLGSLVSVIGISALFGANPIIIALAIALDVGKVVTVSLLYTYWKELSGAMKTYALMAATVTMIITSAGAAGYLTGEFQKSIMSTREGDLKVAVLKEQQAKYELRKKQIDDQIATLPARTTVNQRLRMVRAFQAEQKALDAKIAEIDKSLPALQIAQIGTEAKAGPIVSISKAFKIPMEEAVSWVIAMIIFVFDPLAIFLIIAGNFLWARRKRLKEEAKNPVVQEQPQQQPAPEPYYGYGSLNRFEPDQFMTKPTPVPDEPPAAVQPEGFQTFKPMKGTHSEYMLAFPNNPQKDDVFFDSEKNQMFIYDGTEWVGANTLAVTKENDDDQEWLDKAEAARADGYVGGEPPVETTYEKYETPPVDLRKETPVEAVAEQPARPLYEQSGLLKPVKVEPEEVVVVPQDTDLIPMKVAGIPIHREEITRSTLGIVPPDPATIVDARRDSSFRRADAKR